MNAGLPAGGDPARAPAFRAQLRDSDAWSLLAEAPDLSVEERTACLAAWGYFLRRRPGRDRRLTNPVWAAHRATQTFGRRGQIVWAEPTIRTELECWLAVAASERRARARSDNFVRWIVCRQLLAVPDLPESALERLMRTTDPDHVHESERWALLLDHPSCTPTLARHAMTVAEPGRSAWGPVTCVLAGPRYAPTLGRPVTAAALEFWCEAQGWLDHHLDTLPIVALGPLATFGSISGRRVAAIRRLLADDSDDAAAVAAGVLVRSRYRDVPGLDPAELLPLLVAREAAVREVGAHAVAMLPAAR